MHYSLSALLSPDKWLQVTIRHQINLEMSQGPSQHDFTTLPVTLPRLAESPKAWLFLLYGLLSDFYVLSQHDQHHDFKICLF